MAKITVQPVLDDGQEEDDEDEDSEDEDLGRPLSLPFAGQAGAPKLGECATLLLVHYFM